MLATEYLKSPATFPARPMVVLSGGERFFKLEIIRCITTEVFGTDDPEVPVQRFNGKDADYASVLDSVATVSMWSPRQLVVVNDADEFVSKHRASLEKYADKPARKSILVLEVDSWPSSTRLAKKIAVSGLAIDCSSPKASELTGWLMHAARSRHNATLDRGTASMLVELAGNDLGLLDQELAKLAAFAGSGNAITPAAVKSLVGGWKMETTWKMLDAVRDGQLPAAIELLDNLLSAGEHPLKLLGGINYTWRQYAQAAQRVVAGATLDSALADSGVRAFSAAASSAYLKRVGRERALKFTHDLLAADLDVKGRSALPERIILERLLIQLSAVAQRSVSST